MPSIIMFLLPRRLILWSVLGVALTVTIYLVAFQIRKLTPENRLVDKNYISIPTRKALNSNVLNCERKPYLLILVASAPENFERRSAIRKTWGRHTLQTLQNLSSRMVFLVGQSPFLQRLNDLVENERNSAGDILIGNYLDTYRNLTAKTTHGLLWANQHCQPRYVLKTEDDCFVNVAVLLGLLSNTDRITPRLYVGRVIRNSKVMRDPTHQWYVPREDYSPALYPSYVSGTGCLLSRDALEIFAKNVIHFKPFPKEDAFVGVVLKSVGFEPIHSSRFSVQNGPWRLCRMLYAFVIHPVYPREQKELQIFCDTALVECPMENLVYGWN